MRLTSIVSASFLAAALVAASSVRAEDGPPPRRPPPGEVKKDEGKDAKKDDAALRVERAKQVVKELEEAIVRAKAAQPIDAVLLQRLMEALSTAKALSLPAKPEELTEDEKKAVIDEAKKQSGADPAAPKDPASEWQERALSRAFDGADLSEEESIKAKAIVGDWYKESMGSMGDSKKVSDLKRKRDDDLEKAVGKKKAQKIINNLNSMGPGRR